MTIAQQTINEFLASLASRKPAPGGGAATPLAGAVGCALAEMAIAYSIGRKGLESQQTLLEQAAKTLASLREEMCALADEDAAAFESLGPLLRLGPDDPRRKTELPAAARAATETPLRVISCCVKALRTMAGLEGAINPHLRSDMGIGADLVDAAARASRWNVAINAPTLREAAPGDPDPLERADIELRMAAELSARVVGYCA